MWGTPKHEKQQIFGDEKERMAVRTAIVGSASSSEWSENKTHQTLSSM